MRIRGVIPEQCSPRVFVFLYHLLRSSIQLGFGLTAAGPTGPTGLAALVSLAPKLAPPSSSP